MISSRPIFRILKVVFEAESAHAIHTGHGDTTHDTLIVRDANGLPTLSGSSLAGVLRHQYQQQFGVEATQYLFGYAKGSEGQNSWLNVAWGLVHNSHNKPQEGLLTPEHIAKDALLTKLKDQKPIVRQRVRLNEYGATAGTGKFDVTLMPAGVRYTSWLSYWCDGSDESVLYWNELQTLLKDNPLRIGQGTKDGYGLFKIVNLYQADWDLRTEDGCKQYCQRSRKRENHQGLTAVNLNSDTNNQVRATLSLEAESGWRVGGGEKDLQDTNNSRIPDLLPMHEPRIEWQAGVGHFITKDVYLLPATAIKGALRHRVAYHYNCLAESFCEDQQSYSTDDNPAVKALFGFAQDDESHAGLVALRDIYLIEQQSQTVMHNKIDRYTGGVMHGALFSEVILWKSQIKVELDILQPKKALDPEVKKALALTLDDLSQGWLPLGASGSRGLGIFVDNTGLGVQWSDNKEWIAVEEAI